MKRPSTERANARMRQLVGYVHARVDTEHARPDKQHPDERCRAGCESAALGCCSTMVLIELAEAEYIVSRNPRAVDAARERLEVAGRRIAEAITTEDVASMYGDKAGEARVAATYHALALPCPFLSEARECTIYEDRPLACRTHFVLSPPVECEASGVNMRHVTLDKGTRIGAQAWLVSRVMKERRGRLVFGTLPQLVLEVAQRHGTGPAVHRHSPSR